MSRHKEQVNLRGGSYRLTRLSGAGDGCVIGSSQAAACCRRRRCLDVADAERQMSWTFVVACTVERRTGVDHIQRTVIPVIRLIVVVDFMRTCMHARTQPSQ